MSSSGLSSIVTSSESKNASATQQVAGTIVQDDAQVDEEPPLKPVAQEKTP